MRHSGPAIVLVRNSTELVEALTRRRGALGLSQLDLDELAGFQLGYTGKLERPDGLTRSGKRWGRRCIHPTFDWWLGGLKVGLAVIPLGHIRPARRRGHPDQLCLNLPEPAANAANDVRSCRHGGNVALRATKNKKKGCAKSDLSSKKEKRNAA